MVYTIGPAVRRRSTLSGWAWAALPYVFGSVLGGMVTGGSVGAAGSLLPRSTVGLNSAVVLVMVLSIAAVARDLFWPFSWLPSFQRQVPERWRASLPLGYATFLYGVHLGLGWATRAYFGSYYIMLGLIFLVGRFETGLLIGAAYGLGHAVLILFFPNESNDQIDKKLGKLGRLRGTIGVMSAFGGLVAMSVILAGMF